MSEQDPPRTPTFAESFYARTVALLAASLLGLLLYQILLPFAAGKTYPLHFSRSRRFLS